MCEHIARVISTNKAWKGNLSNLQFINVDKNADQASYEWTAGYAGPRSESQTIVANKAHCTHIRLEYQTEIIPVLCAALCTVFCTAHWSDVTSRGLDGVVMPVVSELRSR